MAPAVGGAALFGAAVLAGAVCALTYDPMVDGDSAALIRLWALAALASGAAALWWRSVDQAVGHTRLPAGERVHRRPLRNLCTMAPAALALAALFAPPGLQAVRHLHPAGHGRAFWVVADDFPGPALAERWWRWQATGGARLGVSGGHAVLDNAPGETLFLEARFLRLHSVHLQWLQPVALAARPYAESLEWRVTVQRRGPFFVLLDAQLERALLRVQATEYGVHVTHPDASGSLVGHEIRHALGSDRAEHRLRLVRDRARLALEIDGTLAWQAPAVAPLTQVRLGETVADPQHGGRLLLTAVRYQRRIQG